MLALDLPPHTATMEIPTTEMVAVQHVRLSPTMYDLEEHLHPLTHASQSAEMPKELELKHAMTEIQLTEMAAQVHALLKLASLELEGLQVALILALIYVVTVSL